MKWIDLIHDVSQSSQGVRGGVATTCRAANAGVGPLSGQSVGISSICDVSVPNNPLKSNTQTPKTRPSASSTPPRFCRCATRRSAWPRKPSRARASTSSSGCRWRGAWLELLDCPPTNENCGHSMRLFSSLVCLGHNQDGGPGAQGRAVWLHTPAAAAGKCRIV